MALPKPPDTQPLSKVYEHQRELAVAADADIANVRRVGRFTMPTNTSGTTQRVNFDEAFPPGVVPVVAVFVEPSAPNHPRLIQAGGGTVDRSGFTAYAIREAGSAPSSTMLYIAVAP